MKTLKKQIDEFKKTFSKQLQAATNDQQLDDVRVAFLGRKGKISQLMAQMKTLSVEDKRIFGPPLNELKQTSEQALHKKKQELLAAHLDQEAEKQKLFDVSAYKYEPLRGSLHIYSQVIEQLENIFISMGYEVADGPEAESDFYNFQAINIPPDHPARDMQDTFWLNVPDMLMRTHTSSIQVREMKKKGAPIAVVAPGRVYRSEATDASHEFVFTQMEGLLVDKNISMANLLATVKLFLQKLFEKENLNIRVRPSYYPFVEPGIDVDFSCPFCKTGCSVCKKTRWIELMGAGLVHPNVLKHGGIDPKIYSGFAFGFGIERIAMIRYGINDIRLFHGNSVDFLKQFQ